MNPLQPRFEPTRDAALAALARVRPHAYAGTRNHLNGAATELSPYLTHGLLTLREAHDLIHQRHPLDPRHKLVYEFGWRAYFRHVWAHRGAGIFESLHPGPLPDTAYSPHLPDDVRQARTGVPVIDQAVRSLYACGHLHNHARMWLASYLVHVRKVFWRVGADWLYGHLLDGDLASNHLSWQWVAGTGSHKPYLFNADNVARFAPPDWHSPGSVIDTSYETLDTWAHTANVPVGTAVNHDAEPTMDADWATPPDASPTLPDWRGRPVWLQHPWALAPPPAHLPADTMMLGLVLRDFHQRHPWSARRWQFVLTAWHHQGVPVWATDAAALAPALGSASKLWVPDNPHLGPWRAHFPAHTQWCAEPPLFAEVASRCESFSRWWGQTQVV